MGYNLLVNGVYWGYNPLTNHLLTSWDIQVGSIKIPFSVSGFADRIPRVFFWNKWTMNPGVFYPRLIQPPNFTVLLRFFCFHQSPQEIKRKRYCRACLVWMFVACFFENYRDTFLTSISQKTTSRKQIIPTRKILDDSQTSKWSLGFKIIRGLQCWKLLLCNTSQS